MNGLYGWLYKNTDWPFYKRRWLVDGLEPQQEKLVMQLIDIAESRMSNTAPVWHPFPEIIPPLQAHEYLEGCYYSELYIVTNGKELWYAFYQKDNEEGDSYWTMQGPDMYTVKNVVAWCDLVPEITEEYKKCKV